MVGGQYIRSSKQLSQPKTIITKANCFILTSVLNHLSLNFIWDRRTFERWFRMTWRTVKMLAWSDKLSAKNWLDHVTFVCKIPLLARALGLNAAARTSASATIGYHSASKHDRGPLFLHCFHKDSSKSFSWFNLSSKYSNSMVNITWKRSDPV